MSDKEIKNSYEGSAKRMRGDDKTLGSKLTPGDFNDPSINTEGFKSAPVRYDLLDPSFTMEEVHRWQREHIQSDDQGKDGYPLNVILDPAMREMYQVVNKAGLSNVFDRFSQQQPTQCKYCIEGLSC